MPIVTVQMAEGQSTAVKHQMMLAMTNAIEESLSIKRASIRIIINEFPLHHFMAGGQCASLGVEKPEPSSTAD